MDYAERARVKDLKLENKLKFAPLCDSSCFLSTLNPDANVRKLSFIYPTLLRMNGRWGEDRDGDEIYMDL